MVGKESGRIIESFVRLPVRASRSLTVSPFVAQDYFWFFTVHRHIHQSPWQSQQQTQEIVGPIMSDITLTLEQNLFVRKPVPEKGIVCSNAERAKRVAEEFLTHRETFSCSWGAQVWVGFYKRAKSDYQQQKIFVALAPVGAGSGLVFTELFSAGAKVLVRYGSDDVKNPEPYEYQNCVKIIDETDNLHGYCQASGVAPCEWGKSVFASPLLLDAFKREASERDMTTEVRICHHLENYREFQRDLYVTKWGRLIILAFYYQKTPFEIQMFSQTAK